MFDNHVDREQQANTHDTGRKLAESVDRDLRAA